MDISPSRWISNWDFDDYDITNQYNVDTFDEFTSQEMASIEESLRQSLSPESNSSYPILDKSSSSSIYTPSGTSFGIDQASQSSSERPSKQLKSNAWNSTEPNVSYTPSSQIFCLDNNINSSSPSDDLNHQQFLHGKLNESVKSKEKATKDVNNINNQAAQKRNQGTKRAQSMKKSLQAQDHIIAERKRREKLSERFIALSALVPGLKKMDKASVLADAVKYIKQLQEDMKVLEDQAKKKPIESIVFVKKSRLSPDDDSSSCDENFDGNLELDIPEIEAKVSEKDVLLRIHSRMQKGFLVNLLSEIEKLHLTVTNSSVSPFQSSIDITIVAQMDAEFSMTGKDLVKKLQDVLTKYM